MTLTLIALAGLATITAAPSLYRAGLRVITQRRDPWIVLARKKNKAHGRMA